MSKKIVSLMVFLFAVNVLLAQKHILEINALNKKHEGISNATVFISKLKVQSITDTTGNVVLQLSPDSYKFRISAVGYVDKVFTIKINTDTSINVVLNENIDELEEVVVTGTMRAVTKAESAVPVELYSPKFFAKAAPQNLFEAITQVNGVKPQINCNICNTGDIHINGMEGPYTQILIDGMPIVSGLAGVYGLMGIPLSMIDKVEIVKGPAGSLYGSEAMGGTINVITKNIEKSPLFSADVNATTYREQMIDVGTKIKMNKADAIIGVNWFHYDNPVDNNNDGFTDVTLQKRISLFNKWNVKRKNNKPLHFGARLFYEDRWGGQMGFEKKFRGGDSVYGESIYTKRLETFGLYQLPVKENIHLQWSLALHDQNSFYGTTSYQARQDIAFAQLYWNKKIHTKHNLLAGTAFRYTFYDDNSVATYGINKNKPQHTYLPGAFAQHEWMISKTSTLLSGLRIDRHDAHGLIASPRIAFKTNIGNSVFRISTGKGFRVVNIFTEEHAALTGARVLEIADDLKPEQSLNSIANWYVPLKANTGNGFVEANIFYSYFSNKIIPDYNTDPDKIFYNNLDGYAVSKGIGINAEWNTKSFYKINIGTTLMDVFQKNIGIKEQQFHAPRFSGNFTLSKNFVVSQLSVDISGNIYGPMRLPILPNDYRPEYSPVHCIMNVQLNKKIKPWEIYGGIKNLLDFIPDNPIMRPFDPFDKNINDPINNPYNYTFDPSYNYASLQGIRGYIGFKFLLR